MRTEAEGAEGKEGQRAETMSDTEILEVLRSMEWTATECAGISGPHCQSCFSDEENGHASDCRLAAAIAELEARAVKEEPCHTKS